MCVNRKANKTKILSQISNEHRLYNQFNTIVRQVANSSGVFFIPNYTFLFSDFMGRFYENGVTNIIFFLRSAVNHLFNHIKSIQTFLSVPYLFQRMLVWWRSDARPYSLVFITIFPPESNVLLHLFIWWKKSMK